uniref:Protein kinase domain-containing protein n=1 Tax=Rhabditophanes sp. KR3021 TaxID=114890 RepID=A0AC35TSG1_9BILA
MICGTPIKTEKSLKSYSTPSRSPKNRSGYDWSLPQKERKEYVLVDRENSKKSLLKRLNPVNWFNSKLKAKDGGYSKSPSVRKAFMSSMFPDISITNVSQLRKVIETPYNQNDDLNIVGASPYRILDQIADGGFSTVYRAEHRLTSTIVAIKKINKSKHYRHPKQKIYLENEKQNMKLLDHRNISKSNNC